MKVTKKHLYHTFDEDSFHDCECIKCDTQNEGADALEELSDKITTMLDKNKCVDIYIVGRKK